MKNNKLHIQYNGLSPKNGANMHHQRCGKNLKMIRIVKADKMYNGRIESMRCTKEERAKEIIKGISRDYIKSAIFKDKFGNEIILIS